MFWGVVIIIWSIGVGYLGFGFKSWVLVGYAGLLGF